MKRRHLSDQELEEVIKRKQSRASWLGIQKETGIPRRAAKRAYENWERSRSLDDLGQVRRDVAQKEFIQHLNHLSKFAESLVGHLRVPESPNTTESGEQFLSRLWHCNIIGEPGAERTRVVRHERETRNIVRQNQLLFKSLRDHTREEIRWEALNQWERAWDNSINLLNELRKEASEVIGNILDQEPGLQKRIQEQSGERHAADRLVDAVLWVIWWAIGEDKLDQDDFLVRTRSEGDGTTHVTYFEYVFSRVLFKFTDADLAEKVAKVCNWAVNNLRKGDKSYRVKSLQNEFCRMKKAIEELEEVFNPLLLRPIILRTRCHLCPA